MENEDKKGFGRFYFSTELDRGEEKTSSNFAVAEEKNEKEKNEKKKSNKRNNRRINNRKSKYPKRNGKKNTEKKQSTVIPYNDSLSTVESGPIPYNDSLSTVVEPVMEEVVVPDVDFKVFGSDEEEVVEEKPTTGPIPYNDSLSTVKSRPIPYNDSLSTVKDISEAALEDKNSTMNQTTGEIDLDRTLYLDRNFTEEDAEKDKVVEAVKDDLKDNLNDTKKESNVRVVKKVYLSFQMRVILLVLGILVLFGTACYIIVSTLRDNEIRKVEYLESSQIHYEVCQETDNPFNSLCFKENDTYTSDHSSKIHINYQYESTFEDDINYDLSYHVVASNKIYDRYDPSKISYEDEDLLIEKTNIKNQGNPLSLDVDVDIDYQKYNQFVTDYKEKYVTNSNSVLNVTLYVDDGSDTRNVGEVIIPLGEDSFEIVKNTVTDSKQVYAYVSKDWTNTNTLNIVIGSILVLLSLFLLFHLTKLVLSVTGKKSKYQEILMNILNEYDRLIVIARDGYESPVEKKIIKLYTFNELLDARSVLNKPIIYSRINNIKSEFIVEDEDVIYKFVLKEADLGE